MRTLQAGLLTCLFFGAITSAAFASGGKSPGNDRAPLPPMDRDLTPVELTPESLQKRLFDENLDIRFSSNAVHRAKVSVNLARARLLPNLNITGILTSFVDPSFIVSTISSFLPFLMPSRWFEMFQAEQLLEADKKAYHALQLNTFSSAYSLVMTIQNDLALKELFEVDLADWRSIEETTRFEFDTGGATENDLAQAIGQRALAEVRVKNLELLVTRELADLRRALGYHPERPITLKFASVPESPFEDSRFDPALDEAYQRAVEREQIDFLIRAAEYEKWARAFSWLGGATISARANEAAGDSSPSFAFEDLTIGGSLDFEWGTFPLIKLSEINIAELKLRKEELARDLTNTLEIALKQRPLLFDRYRLAKESEDTFRENFENNLRLYELGQIAFRDLLLSRLNIAESTTERLRAQMDVDLLRITLHRTFRTDGFSTINGCAVPNNKKNRKKYGIDDSDRLGYCLPVAG